MKKKISIVLALFLLIITAFAPSLVKAESHPNIWSGGVYYIRNIYSGLYLDAANAGTANFTNVVQYNYTCRDNQKWKITKLSNGNYVIRPVYALNMALDVTGNYTANESNVDIYSVGTTNSTTIPSYAQWRFIKSNEGGFIIYSMCSNYTKALTVQGASRKSGANVFQYQFNDDDCGNDMWVLEPADQWTGNSYTSWTNSKPANTGELWLDFYNEDPSTVKSTVNFAFSHNDLNTLRNHKAGGIYFDFDVTTHRSDNAAKSDLSAYAVLTNLPNPVIDIENDILDGDSSYEESEVVCLSPEKLYNFNDYYVITYWLDKRNGKNSGKITATSELSLQWVPWGDYNYFDTYYNVPLNYGKNMGMP